MWIETIHAWYILQKPSKHYKQHFCLFYKPLRIAQIVISAVVADIDKCQTFEDFMVSFVQRNMSGSRNLVKDDLWAAVCMCKAGQTDSSQPGIIHCRFRISMQHWKGLIMAKNLPPTRFSTTSSTRGRPFPACSLTHDIHTGPLVHIKLCVASREI